MTKVIFEKIYSEDEVKHKIIKTIWDEIIDYIIYFIKVFTVVLLTYVFLKNNVLQTFEVSGQSMMPNYHDKDYVFVDKINVRFENIRRGDVIVLHRLDSDCPVEVTTGHCSFIKRVIGLPGEQVELRDGAVYIRNNQYPRGIQLDESSYLSTSVKTLPPSKTTSSYVEPELAPQEYFVLGDNRENSSDSRIFGAVKLTDVEGKELFHREKGFFSPPKYNINSF